VAAPDLIKAVVAYEPGHVVFPENEIPADIPANDPGITAAASPMTVPMVEFMKLTKIPILIVYGDYIPTEPFEVFDADFWRVASLRAKQFAEAVNRHGGEAQVVMLPEIGIRGNSHFPFADLNNIEIADHLEKFLRDKKLDVRDDPHQGPRKVETPLTVPLGK
jgi:hypothetical protein